MSSGKVIYEGKAKSIIATSDPSIVIQHFKDDVTAFNKGKHEIIQGKGIINNYISAFIMSEIGSKQINTHFIKILNDREQLVKKLKIIPLEVVVRNIAAGSLYKRFNMKEGEKLKYPIVEFFHKNDDLADPMVTENHILYFNWLSDKEMEKVHSIALKVNEFLTALFSSVDINLVDFKLEFGRLMDVDRPLSQPMYNKKFLAEVQASTAEYLDVFEERSSALITKLPSEIEFQKKSNEEIVLADEISPDNCRLWDKKTNERLDKDVFRLGLGDLKETYLQIANRLRIKKIFV